jgi:hypothetical protein
MEIQRLPHPCRLRKVFETIDVVTANRIQVFAVGLQSVSITGVFIAGIGYGHVVDIVPDYGLEPITKLSQLIIPLQFLWVSSLSCTKISILCLYLKIFPHRWMVWSSYATISIIVA